MTYEKIMEQVRASLPGMEVELMNARPAVCLGCPEAPGECRACRSDPSMQHYFDGQDGVELRILPRRE